VEQGLAAPLIGRLECFRSAKIQGDGDERGQVSSKKGAEKVAGRDTELDCVLHRG